MTSRQQRRAAERRAQKHGESYLVLSVNQAGTPIWQMDDKRFFKRNPNRKYRVRRAYPGEWPRQKLEGLSVDLPGYTACSAIKAEEPGKRYRTLFALPSTRPLPDDDATCGEMYERVRSVSKTRGRP